MVNTKWNHNLLVTFVFRITFALTQGLWNSGLGSNYIYYLEDERNTLVGVVQAMQGLCIPLASFPGGYIADRTRRDSVLKFFGFAGFVAIGLLIAAVLAPKEPIDFLQTDIKYVLLCVGYCFWGIAQAGNPIVESVLADAVPTGGRSAIYTSLYFLGMLCTSIGPMIAAVIFLADGNRWLLSTLGRTMLVGMLASVIPIASMFFFNDDLLLGDESEAHGRVALRPGIPDGKDENMYKETAQKPRLCGLSQASIPYILSASDLIYGLASGCTIKFFPIFFAKEVQLSPVTVSILMGAQPIIIGLFAAIGQRLSVFIGRVEVLLLMRLVGWSIMAVMGICTSLWTRPVIITTLFLIRTGVNNAGYPIQKAILMDYVPKKSRGRWSAVDSLSQFGWSGSALIGGILVDHAGFDWCFMITAMAQCTGWLVMSPLLALVPHKEASNEEERHEAAAAAAPLLGSEGQDQSSDDAEGGEPGTSQSC